MSKVAIQGNALGSGTFTVAAPNTNSDYTLTLPTQTGTIVSTDASGNVGIGTSSPSSFYSEARNLVVGTGSGGQGMTIYAGNASQSRIMFADGTTGSDSYTGFVQYDHSSNTLQFGTNGGNERMRIDSSGNLLFNSGYGSVATAYGCRAWVNFNGTGTVAIRASGNVSSITDLATGQYRINYSTAMPDGSYAGVCSAWDDGVSPTATSNQRFRAEAAGTSLIYLTNSIGTYADSDQVFAAIFR